MQTRRDFLQKMTGSAIGFSFLSGAGGLSSCNSPKNNNGDNEKYNGPILRVAIMGIGAYGNRVATAMQSCKKAKLVGCISGTPLKVENWHSLYQLPAKNCYNYDNYDDIKNNPDIDVVYVCVPNALHHDHVLRIAKAGKHVICEKPMALNVKEGREMIDACKQAGVRLLVGYRMHFEPHTLEVIRMRKAGEFGKITFFQGLTGFVIGEPTQWRLNKALSGGGSLMDIGIYSLNGARYMTGEEPIWVTAQETKTDPVKFKEGIDETLQFQLGFPSGVTASCLSTYNQDYLDRFFLDGTKGFAELYPATNYGPIQGRTHKGELNQPVVTHQTVQMDEMSGILLQGKQSVLPVDGEEAVKDLRIIEAIYQAARTGQRVDLST